jgi:hypothetical protein
MRKMFVACLVIGFGLAIAIGSGAQDKPKYTIKDVMKTAHKGGLLKKVSEGKASDEEKQKLVDMYEALAASKPPKGEDESWKTKTTALVEAAKAAQKGDTGKLKAAADCKACHTGHKG